MDIVERLEKRSKNWWPSQEPDGGTMDREAAEEIKKLRNDNDLACAINEELAAKYNVEKADNKRLQAENERLRVALQRIADASEFTSDGYSSAPILSGIAWAALDPQP